MSKAYRIIRHCEVSDCIMPCEVEWFGLHEVLYTQDEGRWTAVYFAAPVLRANSRAELIEMIWDMADNIEDFPKPLDADTLEMIQS